VGYVMHPIRALLADYDCITRTVLRSTLEQTPGLMVCGETDSGERALGLVHEMLPDVLVTDLVLKERDGLTLLRDLWENPPPVPPRILVLSRLDRPWVRDELQGLGVDYYMLKPVYWTAVAENIIALCSHTGGRLEFEDPELRDAIWLLSQLAGTRKLMGIRYAALSAREILNGLYEHQKLSSAYLPAQRESGGVRSRIEKNIRDLIARIHERDTVLYRQLMGGRPSHRPSNKEFLMALAAWLEKRQAEKTDRKKDAMA